jgi:hypothetical protein
VSLASTNNTEKRLILRLVETDHGTVIGTIYGIPPEINRLIDDDKISPEEFKKMDIVHNTKGVK